jgi:shikimate dehydrogenase
MKQDEPFVLGLLGYPLSHSFSPAWFERKFKEEGFSRASYRLYALPDISLIRVMMVGVPGLLGFNVTIPHKKAIMAYLDRLSPEAEAVGAVNTVLVQGDTWFGYNTDVLGFEASLSDQWDSWNGRKGLILGSGGAAAAASYVMLRRGMEVVQLSRREVENLPHALPDPVSRYALIVNATPVGMHPNVHEFPVLPYAGLRREQFVYDMVYNPEKTLFLARAEEAGAIIVNGLAMLHGQAEAAWQIWKSALKQEKKDEA